MQVWTWLLNVIFSAGLLGAIGILFRDTLSKYFIRKVDHHFQEKLEKFKAEIRENEKELEQIRSFLITAHRDRDSALQSKRLEAAETLFRACRLLLQLLPVVEFMKAIKVEKVLEASSDSKVAEVFSQILTPLDVDEKFKSITSIDLTLPRLYLSERSLQTFEVYQGIILQAATIMKMLAIPLEDKAKLINFGSLQKSVTELVPSSAEGFAKWGDSYAYYWVNYFYDEIFKSLREQVAGTDEIKRNSESITRLSLESRNAQLNARSAIQQKGLPEILRRPEESAEVASSVTRAI